MQTISNDRLPAWLLWAWGILTLATLGLAPLFDYDETIYAQTAIDMMHHGQWVVPVANGMQFFEKPPFTYYMMDLCFSIFGDNAFAARLPSALFSFATALLLLHFGTRLHSRRFGFAAAAIFLSMLEVGFLAHAAILDAVLNFFIAATLLNYALWLQTTSRKHALWCAAMMGAAVSIKGPVGAVVPVLVIVIERLLSGNFGRLIKDIPWLTALPLFLLVAIPWYVMILIDNGPEFLYEFIWVHNIGRALNPMQGHGGAWHYYIVVFAVSVLPWLAAIPWAFQKAWPLHRNDDVLSVLARLALVWTALVIVLFSFAQTKLPHYISCIYPGVAMLIAAAWLQDSPAGSRATRLVGVTAVLLLPIALLLLAFPALYPWLQTMVHHPRAVAILAQDIHPTHAITAFGAVLLAALAWLVRYRHSRHLLAGFVVVGMVLQFSLLVGLGTFAARIMQAPTMQIADTVRALPANVAFYSYNLNAPSASFYAGRNYALQLDARGAAELAAAKPPYALMLRSESLPELEKQLPWLATQTPSVDRGGYLLYVVTTARKAGS
ncbi:MAG TPA: glycosyltransferase family 39 protein [Mariprofundaceae bacterium]|nr:glycosyltransferase family 39 protein [Mariprofundaceae bacterium]